MPTRAESARASAARRYEDAVDPERKLDPATRALFAEQAKFARLQEMRRRSIATRQAKAAARRQSLAA